LKMVSQQSIGVQRTITNRRRCVQQKKAWMTELLRQWQLPAEVQLVVNSTIDCKRYSFILHLAPGSFLATTEA